MNTLDLLWGAGLTRHCRSNKLVACKSIVLCTPSKRSEPAKQAGFTGAYTVLKVDALERSKYKDFEADSDAQVKIKEFLDEKVDLTEQLAEGIATLVKGVRSFNSVKEVLKHHRALQDATTDEKREEIKKDIDAELKKMIDENSSLLKKALEL